MALQSLSLVRGNSHTFTITLKDGSGNPYCIKNWVVFFTLKSNWGLPDTKAALQKIVTTFADTTSGTSGVAEIPLTRSDTINLDIGSYDYDIQVLTNQSKSYTVMKGKFDLLYNVTTTAGTAGTAT